MATQKTLKGTVLKMTVGFSYTTQTSLTLDDIDDWYTEWYCKGKKYTVKKSECLREVSGSTVNYYAYVDTSVTGDGILKMRLYVPIPDTDSSTGYRIEYAEISTDIVIG